MHEWIHFHIFHHLYIRNNFGDFVFASLGKSFEEAAKWQSFFHDKKNCKTYNPLVCPITPFILSDIAWSRSCLLSAFTQFWTHWSTAQNTLWPRTLILKLFFFQFMLAVFIIKFLYVWFLYFFFAGSNAVQRPSLSRLRLSRITAYLEEKIWSLF